MVDLIHNIAYACNLHYSISLTNVRDFSCIVYAYNYKNQISEVTQLNSYAKWCYIRTKPWLVSTKAPDPADAKFAPYVNWSLPGCRYGGINGNSAYSAVTAK